MFSQSIRRYDCKPGGGDALYTHSVIKKYCKDCKGKGLCEHGTRKCNLHGLRRKGTL